MIDRLIGIAISDYRNSLWAAEWAVKRIDWIFCKGYSAMTTLKVCLSSRKIRKIIYPYCTAYVYQLRSDWDSRLIASTYESRDKIRCTHHCVFVKWGRKWNRLGREWKFLKTHVEIFYFNSISAYFFMSERKVNKFFKYLQSHWKCLKQIEGERGKISQFMISCKINIAPHINAWSTQSPHVM